MTNIFFYDMFSCSNELAIYHNKAIHRKEADMERKLLHTPEGVRDIYNGESTQKLYIQDKIHNSLKLY